MAEQAKSVLVVEDDREINSLIGAYVEISGLGHRAAFNGANAVRTAERETPAAVVLDLMLPDIDGYEVCRRLRANPATAKTPIIILSALGGEEDRKRGRECGANEHLTKPFDPDQFMRVLKDHVGLQQSG